MPTWSYCLDFESLIVRRKENNGYVSSGESSKGGQLWRFFIKNFESPCFMDSKILPGESFHTVLSGNLEDYFQRKERKEDININRKKWEKTMNLLRNRKFSSFRGDVQWLWVFTQKNFKQQKSFIRGIFFREAFVKFQGKFPLWEN